jgi:hypothetical protein
MQYCNYGIYIPQWKEGSNPLIMRWNKGTVINLSYLLLFLQHPLLYLPLLCLCLLCLPPYLRSPNLLAMPLTIDSHSLSLLCSKHLSSDSVSFDIIAHHHNLQLLSLAPDRYFHSFHPYHVISLSLKNTHHSRL